MIFINNFSTQDYGTDLKPAHDCVAKKCPVQWAACKDNCADDYAACVGWARQGYCDQAGFKDFMTRNCAKSCKTCGNKNENPGKCNA